MSQSGHGLSRRRLLGLGGAGVAGALLGAGGARLADAGTGTTGEPGSADEPVVPFAGAHQAGIATPVQDRLHMCAFDVITSSRAELRDLLRAWTAAARAMTTGRPVGPTGAVTGPDFLPPSDTGEALGLPASRLTLTIGFGPTLFTRDGVDRFGLAARRPEPLTELPHFPGDALEPARSGGDLVVQACADDPQVAVHAIRTLARIGFGAVSVRWSQLGFGKTSSTTPHAATPRNLFGFKDGTANIAGEDMQALRRHVWVGPEADGPHAWLAGGTYLVARRIRMHIETWDREPLGGQEQIIGRTKGVGAPLGGAREHDPVDPASLPADSHVALAHPQANAGHRMLRRGYSFVDGSDGLGRLEAGLFFIAFVRDPGTQFVPLQDKLARRDALSEYLVHTGSGVWACPPGVQGPDDYWGRGLLEA